MKKISFFLFFLFIFTVFIHPQNCKGRNGVIIFLVDNSKSVPKFDPHEDRKEVLGEMEKIAQKNGYETRLILFGGRYEIYTDDISKFDNSGLHTDFYYAFKKAIDITKEYPESCKFKIVFITDGVLDVYPSDYKEYNVISKEEAMNLSKNMLFSLLKENKIPTFIILLGNKYDRDFIYRIAQDANSSLRVNPLVEKVADILKNRSIFFKKFIYVVPENSPKKVIKNIVKEISKKSSFKFEFTIVIVLFIIVIIIWFFSLLKYPAPGDREVFEFDADGYLLIGADKRGIYVVYNKYDASARFSYSEKEIKDFKKRLSGIDKLNTYEKNLLTCNIDEIQMELKEMERSKNDEEARTAIDLSYYCSNLSDTEIEKIFNSKDGDLIDAKEFLLAVVYLSMAPELKENIFKKRFFVTTFRGNLTKKEINPGDIFEVDGYKLKLSRLINKDNRIKFEIEILKVPHLKWRLIPEFIRKPISSIFIKRKY